MCGTTEHRAHEFTEPQVASTVPSHLEPLTLCMGCIQVRIFYTKLLGGLSTSGEGHWLNFPEEVDKKRMSYDPNVLGSPNLTFPCQEATVLCVSSGLGCSQHSSVKNY